MSPARPSPRRRGRWWSLLMTAVAVAAVREAAFARNRAHHPPGPTPAPRPSTAPTADATTAVATPPAAEPR